MIPESEYEKRERQQREREEMRQAVANYTGPIRKIPQGKTGPTVGSGDAHHTKQRHVMVMAGSASAHSFSCRM
jgi:hypothetical protein